MYNFEKIIKNLLVSKDMTINVLASKAGISQPTIHSIFNRNEANTKQLEKIAEVLEVPVSYFFGEGEIGQAKAVSCENCPKLQSKIIALQDEVSKLKDELLATYRQAKK